MACHTATVTGIGSGTGHFLRKALQAGLRAQGGAGRTELFTLARHSFFYKSKSKDTPPPILRYRSGERREGKCIKKTQKWPRIFYKTLVQYNVSSCYEKKGKKIPRERKGKGEIGEILPVTEAWCPGFPAAPTGSGYLAVSPAGPCGSAPRAGVSSGGKSQDAKQGAWGQQGLQPAWPFCRSLSITRSRSSSLSCPEALIVLWHHPHQQPLICQ